jgi:membrane-associated phospholipid phosphatase
MPISPTEFDLWLAGRLAAFAAAHRQFSLAIESGIRHTVLGGLWFGATLFVVWVQAGRTGQRERRLRVLSILVGSVLAILLTLAAGALISWPPPIRLPTLQELYPPAMQTNPNTNCFPSQSTAAYGAIAAGIYSLHKTWGWLLWALVVVCVALPRMYVGGHYLTDVLVGAALGLIGCAAARYLLEARFISPVERLLGERSLPRLLLELLIFVWIVQVTVEFREVTWAQTVLRFFFG